MAKGTCSIYGCQRTHHARGWCHSHWQRWRKTGDPGAEKPIDRRSPGATCVMDGCSRPRHARGWCSSHYAKWKHHGDPTAPTRRKPSPPDRLCIEADCEREAHARGLCSTHYGRVTWNPTTQQREEAAARTRRWYRANRERARQAKRDYARRNPDRIRNLNARRKAAKRNAPVNDLTADQWRAIQAAYGHRCAYCRCKPVEMTMDHVEPLAHGGSHTASNVVPACAPCNLRKNAGPAPAYQQALLV